MIDMYSLLSFVINLVLICSVFFWKEFKRQLNLVTNYIKFSVILTQLKLSVNCLISKPLPLVKF